ncbi:IclR family transcriptional regulator [Trebonia kvetii]|uniref:IclR family transcriptional regulator n=1 Tax=Trebonia kvetii TaxID=2480626 RepID=A0A6P2CAQ4_9ACTN|nr:IclR family transcriptional regulator [Trebonia kvetii]TVZ06643.1 IclR family transcriptional regulator [Trebonia kvetii]
MSEAPSSMVDRVVLILSIFERSSAEALTAGQISVRSGIPRSSVHRILSQLVCARWLNRHEDGYALGLRMFEIGSLVAHRSRITSAARPFIHELTERTGQVVHLAVLDQQDVVYLDKVASAFADRAFADTLPSRVGGRLPAHCTAVGKALLAYSPLATVSEYLATGLRRRTDASLATPAALEAAIVGIRNSGHATDRDEAVPGVACVAAPIRNFDEVIAAVSVCGPRDQMRAKDLPPLVMWTAAEISRSLMTVVSPLALAGPAR